MATGYTILKGDESLCTIVTTGGEPVAYQVPVVWCERIVIALKLLDAHERDSRVATYIEQIKEEMGLT